ncbi:helix-turn-helix domain-containing protein [Burkholderia stagnalis]
MAFPVQTLNQLRPILVGFRKSEGLTQAQLAARLGVTQQSYAQLEANPAAVSIERLFKVLNVLGVRLTLDPGMPDAPAAPVAPGPGRRRPGGSPDAGPAAAKAAPRRAAAPAPAKTPAGATRKRPAAATPARSRPAKREDW